MIHPGSLTRKLWGAPPCWLALAAACALWVTPIAVLAALPAAYRPVVIGPSMPSSQAASAASSAMLTQAEFDLTEVLARARREGKWLYMYLGAKDCPYCQRYEAFLQSNAAELLPHFGKYIVVDLRSALSVTAKQLSFKVDGVSRGYADFLRGIGDERWTQLVYPSVFLLDAGMKPLMQMPAGAGTFMTVPEQLEILRLQQ